MQGRQFFTIHPAICLLLLAGKRKAAPAAISNYQQITRTNGGKNVENGHDCKPATAAGLNRKYNRRTGNEFGQKCFPR
jgi:hypothetical protein